MSDPCRHEDKMRKFDRIVLRLESGRHAIFEWLTISAAIAVLVFVFHIYASMNHLVRTAENMAAQIEVQNKLLAELNYHGASPARKGDK